MLQTAFFSGRVWGQTEPPTLCASIGTAFVPDFTIGSVGTALSQADLVAQNGSYLVQNKKILVSSNFSVLNGSLYFRNCDIMVSPSTEIAVSENIFFQVENCKIFSCQKMWRGIRLQKSASLCFRGNRIEDAENAIQAAENCVLFVGENDFNRNYVGISFQPVNPNLTTPQNLLLNNFYSNRFHSSSLLHDPYNGQATMVTRRSLAGMSLKLCNVTIGNFATPATANQFFDIKSGIRLDSSTARITNCSFYNIFRKDFIDSYEDFFITNYTSSGVAIAAKSSTLWQTGFGKQSAMITFRDCNLAVVTSRSRSLLVRNNRAETSNAVAASGFVWSIDNYSSSSISIVDNRFVARGSGVSTNIPLSGILVENGYGLAQARRNHITINNFTTTVGGTSFDGITIKGSPKSTNIIDSDTIIFNNVVTSATYTVSEGLYFRGDGSLAMSNNFVSVDANSNVNFGLRIFSTNGSEVSNNRVAGTLINSQAGFSLQNGIYADAATVANICNNSFTNTNTAMRIENNCSGTSLKTNTFANYQRGLFLLNATLLQNQTRFGNRWIGNFNNLDAEYLKLGPLTGIDKFFVESTDYPLKPFIRKVNNNSDGANSVIWFQTLPGTTNYSCNVSAAATLNETDMRVINATFQGGSAVQNWEADQYVYGKLLKQPDLNVTPESNAFFTQKAASSSGQFAEVAAKMNTIGAIDAATQNQIKDWEEQQLQLGNDIEQIDQAELVETCLWNIKPLAAKQDKLTAIQTIALNMAALQTQLTDEKNKSANKAKNSNNNLPSNTIFEANSKLLNELRLQKILNDSDWSDSELVLLRSIANQCPTTGGTAVIGARAALPSGEQITYYDRKETGCATEHQASNNGAASQKDAVTLRAYPNPASNMVMVEYPNWTEPMKIRLFNSLGVELKIFWLNAAKMEIPLQLPTGLYRLSATLPNGKTWTNTLQIINN